jgi:hypothetical protein
MRFNLSCFLRPRRIYLTRCELLLKDLDDRFPLLRFLARVLKCDLEVILIIKSLIVGVQEKFIRQFPGGRRALPGTIY